MRDHDFAAAGQRYAIPYGIYDEQANAGFVNVGTGGNTAAPALFRRSAGDGDRGPVLPLGRPGPAGHHVPRKPGLDDPEALALRRRALPPLARAAWQDLTNADGRLRFDHDVYLKLWQLSGPRLPAGVINLDEAQDANPVIAAIVEGQSHAQLVAVGDSCQAIHGWRGVAPSRLLHQDLALFGAYSNSLLGSARGPRWLALISTKRGDVGCGKL